MRLVIPSGFFFNNHVFSSMMTTEINQAMKDYYFMKIVFVKIFYLSIFHRFCSF